MNLFWIRWPRNTSSGCPFFSYMANRKKGQHHQDHAKRRRGGSQACLCQKEKRHAYQRRRSETDHLSFGQPEQDLALYSAQVLRDCYISQCFTPATVPRCVGGDWTSPCSHGFSQCEIPPCYHLLSAVWKSVRFRGKDSLYAAWTPRREKTMGGGFPADCGRKTSDF